MLKEYRLKVLDAEPVYSVKSKEGHFLVSIEEYNNKYNLSFIPVLAFILKKDEKLMEYVEKYHDLNDPKTKISDIIHDLVELGIPMDDYIQKYFDFMVESMSRELNMLSTLLSFFNSHGDSEFD
jgi:hypothetical protein